MVHISLTWALALVATFVCLSSRIPTSRARVEGPNREKSAVFLSPRFELRPGSVVEKYYYGVEFPRGHIGLKSFNAEVVDERGHPVPLHETYLHHWTVSRLYQRKGVEVPKHSEALGFHSSDRLRVRNSGMCDNFLGQYFGLGSETRRTLTEVPDPYAIEIGNPSEIPEGYEEIWMLNVHAIDTRGAEDRLGCTECRCDLYNVTVDANGRLLMPSYVGGLMCCYDETRCRVRKGFEDGAKRGLYMRYTVKWVDWDDSLVPVRIYILDVTDLTGLAPHHRCMVEYNVESCSGEDSNGCIDTKRVSITMPHGGYVIYATAHQHTGGVGSALYGQDGRVLCSSLPTYGQGEKPGNEEGYIVGMSTCYPTPGSVKIYDGETLTLESNYTRDQKMHTGVMGLFYILVADGASSSSNSLIGALVEKHPKFALSGSILGISLFGVAIVVAVLVAYLRRGERENSYESINA